MSIAIRTPGTVGRTMPRVHRQLLALAQNGLVRPGPDPTYADGDDATWMEVDWPALTRQVEIDGRTVNVVDSGGDKPAMLFVHGLGGRWQNWLLNLPAFMREHRVIAPDLPGFGDSEMPRGEIAINRYARTLDRLLEALGVDSAVVVGNSMGGFVGAELAINFSRRVEQLVLVSAAGLSIEHQRREPLLTLARAWAATTTRATAGADVVVKRPRLRRVALQTVVRYPERLSGPLAFELVASAGRPGFIPALEALMDYSFRDSLERIEVPTLIVWGRNDMMVPVGDAERFERLIGANAHKVIFEDTGHVPMLERPSRFNELLAQFVAGDEEPEQDIAGVSA
jgi:pimeloyl-ACP methyl ester carboxylesterase